MLVLLNAKKETLKDYTKKAKKGEIKNMTGISSPYEAPENPALERLIQTKKQLMSQCKKLKKCIIEAIKYGKLYN